MEKMKRLMSFRGTSQGDARYSESSQNSKENTPRRQCVATPPIPAPSQAADEREKLAMHKVQFQVDYYGQKSDQEGEEDEGDDRDLFTSLSTGLKRPNLQRTRSRSVECVKGPAGKVNLRRSILKGPREDLDQHSAGSEMSLDVEGGVPHFRKSRSQSYYAFRYDDGKPT